MGTTKTTPQTLPTPRTATPRRQPRYAVVLHNDDVNTAEFVIVVLHKIFFYPPTQCIELMLEAHETGRSVVWVGPLEVAELKADQIHACGPDPTKRHEGAEHPCGSASNRRANDRGLRPLNEHGSELNSILSSDPCSSVFIRG